MSKNMRAILILVVIYMVIFLNWVYPVIRFENRSYNLIFMATSLVIPILCFLWSFTIKQLVLKIVAILSFGILSLISVLFILLIVLNISFIDANGNDPSFESLRAIQVEDYRILTYRLNGGAMSSYSILVRQEKELVLGLKLVRDIYSADHKGDVDIEWNNHVVMIDGELFKLYKNIYY